jgi:hypothetical protein
MNQRLCSVIRTKMNKSQSLLSRIFQLDEGDSKFSANPGTSAKTEVFLQYHKSAKKSSGNLMARVKVRMGTFKVESQCNMTLHTRKAL